MRGSLLILLTFLLMIPPASQALAQEEERPRGHLGIMAGLAFPEGSFGKSDWDNEKSGYGVRGTQYTFADFSIRFVDNFGIAGSVRGFNIPLDVKYLANKYAETYGGQFTVESERWNFGGLFAGPFLCLPVGEKVEFDLRFMPGIFVAFSPNIIISRGNETAEQEASTGTSIGINASFLTRLHLSPRFSFMIGMDYLTARPVFILDDQDNDGFHEKFYQEISTFSISAGFGLRIFRK